MEMTRCTAAILLVLSLEALVAGRLSADDGVDTIRLPSQGPGVAGQEATAEAAAAEGPSPWKCCDLSRCTKSFPPTCSCLDKVKKCAKTCERCEKADGSNGASSRYVCRDTYGKIAPPCTNKTVAADVRRGLAGHEAAAAVSEKSVVDGEQDAGPWKCCDLSRCTKSFPPTCSCLDKVKKCAKNCEKCEKVAGSDGASSRYVCRDTYGKVAPPCTKTTVAADVQRGN